MYVYIDYHMSLYVRQSSIEDRIFQNNTTTVLVVLLP